MSNPRIRARLWVDACLAACRSRGVMAAVLASGDPDSGSVLIKWRPPGGQGAVLTRMPGPDGERIWVRATGPENAAEQTCDEYWKRQRARDPDIWVLEIESDELWHPLDEPLEESQPTPSEAESLFRQTGR